MNSIVIISSYVNSPHFNELWLILWLSHPLEKLHNDRDILESILQSGITRGVFISLDALDIQIAINSMIGTINWSLYDLLIVKNENIEPDDLATRLSAHILRGLGYGTNTVQP